MEVYGNFFSDFANRYGFDIAKSLVHIEIELLRICQQKCSYCFARNEPAPWGKLLEKKYLDNLITEMKSSIHPLRVTLMGGEPSLYPGLNDVASRIVNLKQVQEVEIFTNALKFVNLPDNVRVIASYHPDHCLDVDLFKKNVLKYHETHKVIVYIMTILTPATFRKMQSMYNWCNQHSIACNLEYIFIENGRLERYNSLSEDDYKLYRLMDKHTRYVVFGDEKIPVDDVFNNNMMSFKGAQCFVTRLLKVDIQNPTTFRIECNAMKNPRVPIKGYLQYQIEPMACTQHQCSTLADISTYKTLAKT